MTSFVECVVAPCFEEEALAVFNDQETFKLNKSMRVLQCLAGALLVCQVFVLARLLHGAMAGLLAAAACAVSYELLNLDAYILTEPLYTLLFLNFVTLLAMTFQDVLRP